MLRSSILLLSLPLCAALAGTAHAQTCPLAADVLSYSRTAAGPPDDNGPFSGHPAASALSSGFHVGYYNFVASAALTIDQGWFSTQLRVGGDETIRVSGSDGASANSIGNVFDCLLMGGYQGSGRLHIPIRLNGGAFISWTIGGVYQPPAGYDPAVTNLTMLCAADANGSFVPCDDPSILWDATTDIDTMIELVLPFTFGTSVSLQYGPRVSAGVGYAANGQEGFLSGMANLDLEGLLLPAYVTDLAGTPLPEATIATASGFDFLHPAPAPGSAAGTLAAIAALAALRRVAAA